MHHRGWAPALAAECGLATNYRTVDHPSLPNYAGAVTGLPYASLKPIKSDCNPSKRCSTFAPSIFGEWAGRRARKAMPVSKRCATTRRPTSRR
ncbi:MAG TPA: hypothetical protein VFW71_11890 [Actinomycetota bacterium]|nr:hypothetical protein [Actinomycetota bacterium]